MVWIGDVDCPRRDVATCHQNVDAPARRLQHGNTTGVNEGGGATGALQRAVDHHRIGRVGHVQNPEAVSGDGSIDAAVGSIEHFHIL